ncbi:MAG: hypothetical protein ACLS85_03705 [Coprobacillus cateniformis]
MLKKGYLNTALYDQNNNIIYQAKQLPLTNFSFGLTNVNLWSSENPYLYKLLLTVYDHDDNLVEVIPQKIGFREFKMDQGIMKLNGQRIVFRGVNRHEFLC